VRVEQRRVELQGDRLWRGTCCPRGVTSDPPRVDDRLGRPARLQRSQRGGVRSDHTEQVGLIAQHREVAQTVPAVSQEQRDVCERHARIATTSTLDDRGHRR
jgi:hypothetical protein